MDRMDVDGIETLLNKAVIVYYNDGVRVTRKNGRLLSAGSNFLLLQTTAGQEAISTKNIVRVALEVMGHE